MEQKKEYFMELKELTKNFIDEFGALENFNLNLLTDSNCEKFLKLINNDLETDYLQKIWQFYMADREDKKQDFTPKSLGKLLAELTKKDNEEWVYDICSGSGALTIQKWATNKELKFVCEELDERIIPFLLFNLKIRNIEGYVVNKNVLTGEQKQVYKLKKGDKFSNIEPCMFFEYPKFSSGICNPPFNLKGEYDKEVKLKNMNFVFIFKMLEKVEGNFAFILPGIVTSSKAEKEARKYFTEKKKIRAIISTPEKMFESTNIPVTILYFEDNSEEISFVYCVTKNYSVDKREQRGEGNNKNRTYIKEVNYFSDENIKTILNTISEKIDILEFSKTINNKEIKNDSWLFGYYIDINFEDNTIRRSYEDILKDLERVLRQKNQNKLTINEVWAKELGFIKIYEDACEGDEIIEEVNGILKKTLELDIDLPKQNFLTLSKYKELKWENKDKEELSSAITIALQTWKTMLHFLNKEENRYLAELRDKLLPDLMSGKLELKTENE